MISAAEQLLQESNKEQQNANKLIQLAQLQSNRMTMARKLNSILNVAPIVDDDKENTEVNVISAPCSSGKVANLDLSVTTSVQVEATPQQLTPVAQGEPVPVESTSSDMSISDHATLKAKYKEHRNKRKSISACEADFRKWEREKQLDVHLREISAKAIDTEQAVVEKKQTRSLTVEDIDMKSVKVEEQLAKNKRSRRDAETDEKRPVGPFRFRTAERALERPQHCCGIENQEKK